MTLHALLPLQAVDLKDAAAALFMAMTITVAPMTMPPPTHAEAAQVRILQAACVLDRIENSHSLA